jgi:hypothetical protein
MLSFLMTTTFPTPSTQKVRRDVLGGKRGDGHRRDRPIQRPDPHRIRLGAPDPTLTGVAGLVPFGAFLADEGIDRALHDAFGSLKDGPSVVYPMAAQLRLLMDAFAAGEARVFGLEALAAARCSSASPAASCPASIRSIETSLASTRTRSPCSKA